MVLSNSIRRGVPAISYVVMNARSARNSLVGVSADGSSMSTIAGGAAAFGLAKGHEEP